MKLHKEARELFNEINGYFIIVFLITNLKTQYSAFSWIYMLMVLPLVLALNIIYMSERKKRRKRRRTDEPTMGTEIQ